MKRLIPIVTLAVACALEPGPVQTDETPNPAPQYTGMCDASTAVAVGMDRFLVVNDEDNILRLYNADKPGPALVARDITDLLTLENKKKEADIEGSAALGGALYWITSHGRNKDGEIKRNRYQLFALTLAEQNGEISLARTGKPYTRLMEDMLQEEGLKDFMLDPLKEKENPALAPEQKGTNIEGLAAWQRDQLLIAFRNPIPGGKALLVPLQNPARVVEGDKAKFGKPIQLDLGGFGIRSIELWPQQSAYLIVAGPSDDQGAFQLFQWSGDPSRQPERIQGADLSSLNPEAIVVYPDRNDIQLLSDDGGLAVDGTACKDLTDPARRTFRSRWISLPSK
ncbi:MAG TPA: DUF3616 domain-containing protein [Thermoanaerobaculia bacterium]|nr:DUF3616 domain-containing protein [Thermoanaerobaculia bacterium]